MQQRQKPILEHSKKNGHSAALTQGLAVKVKDDDEFNIATDASAPAWPVVTGGAVGKPVSAMFFGIALVHLAGTLTAGVKLTPTTGGKWTSTTTDTNHFNAILLRGGGADDLREALIVPAGMVAG